jgi:hyperosmotically inducible protein
MTISTSLLQAALVAAVLAVSACAQGAGDTALTATTGEDGAVLEEAKQDGGNALDAISAGADKALDATRDGAAAVLEEAKDAGEKTADATKDVVAAAGRQTSDALSSTGEAITDGWITTKVRARFVDDALLEASDIDVDIDDRVVTLTGTVRSDAAKVRAAGLARSTEGVTRVVNQLVVTSN